MVCSGRFTLREALQEFLDFRYDVIRRRAAHRLSEASARDHVVEGLLQALSSIDAIIDLIRKEPDRAGAKTGLCDPQRYNLTEAQVS